VFLLRKKISRTHKAEVEEFKAQIADLKARGGPVNY